MLCDIIDMKIIYRGCDDMNELEILIKLSHEYDMCFEKARTMTDLQKCRCWFDRKNVVNNEVAVKLTQHGVVIQYHTPKGTVQESCVYDGVLGVTEMREGIMMRLSHKRLLFLPAADNRKETELLMQAAIILGENCKYIFRKSCLCINKVGLLEQIAFRCRRNQGHYDGGGYLKGALILLICAILFMATVFVLQPANNRIVSESEAISVVATYSDWKPIYGRRYDIRGIDLEFDDYEELTVDGSCSNSDLIKKVESVPSGTKMHLLVHPQSDNVLQIDVNGDMLLEFSDAQNRIWRESVAFAAMGLVMYGIAIALSISMIRKKL